MHEVLVTKRFEKDFMNVRKHIRDQILEKISGLRKKPYDGKRLHGKLKGYYSLRHGEYRILYSVDEKQKKVTLEHCGHRKKIYKNI